MADGDPILSLDDLVNLTTGGGSGSPEVIWWQKGEREAGAAAVATVVGRITSLWRTDGSPSGGATPSGASSVPTNATAGSLKHTNAGGSRIKRLSGLVASCLTTGVLTMYDRLAHSNGLSGTSTSAQTTNLPTATLTRSTNGIGVMAYAEIYTALGATATTFTCSYTNTASASKTSLATAIGGAGLNNQSRMIPMSLASGDVGVKAVASLTLAASTLTAGDFGVTLGIPLVALPIPLVGVAASYSALLVAGGPLAVAASSCLAFMWNAGTTTTPIFSPGCAAYFLEK